MAWTVVQCRENPTGGGALTATGAAFVRGGYQWPISPGVEALAGIRLPRSVRLVVGHIHLVTAVIWFGTIFYVHIVLRPKELTSGIPRTERRLDVHRYHGD